MIISISICLASLIGLVALLRYGRQSMGLPAAYLFALLLIHVPGALAHFFARGALPFSEYTELGIQYTAIGSASFVVGVALIRFLSLRNPEAQRLIHPRFPIFCLVAGWLFTYSLSRFTQIPTLGAVVEFGGAVWMLGVLLGLRHTARTGDFPAFLLWLSALVGYPIVMLVVGGFLSYGSTAVIVVLFGLVPFVRSRLRMIGLLTGLSLFAFNGFLNYFQHREQIREKVWAGAPLGERVDVTLDVLSNFEWFNPANDVQLDALDRRLNQNYFVGLAASRIATHQVELLDGRSVWEGVLALVPRALWPEKPVFGGSPKIVAEMTGLVLSENTSWGVGNVMEFQINFGTPGVIGGFLLLGLALGYLDKKVARAVIAGRLGDSFKYFLPAAALIQPNGSIVEIMGGAGAAFVAAFGWRWLWNEWRRTLVQDSVSPQMQKRTFAESSN